MLITTGKISQAEVLNDCITVVVSAIFSSSYPLSKHDISGQWWHSEFTFIFMLVLLGKSVRWHPARTGCFPLTHTLRTATCWHCSCLNLIRLAAMEGAVCSQPCPLAHMGWAQQTAGFSRDPRKSSPSFAAVPARSASRARGKTSVSIPSPRCIRSSLAVTWDKKLGPNPEKWLHFFNQSSNKWDQEQGDTECYLMAACNIL